MKRLHYFLALVAFGLVTVSCSEEFLEKTPQGQFSSETTKSPEGVEGLLIGAYAMVDGTGLNGQAAWHNEVSNWVFGGVTSDNALKGTDAGDQPEQSFLETYNFTTNNEHVRNKWRGLYKGIARTNDVITTLRLVEEISDERRAEIIAEARFLRGFFHFEAQKMWREPIYVGDDVYDVNDVESTKVPNSGDIWAQIEADFAAAEEGLPDSQGQVGRPTKLAATAYLAKAKVYQGWDDDGNANTAKLMEAKPLLEKIINSGSYSLVDKFSDNFFVATRNNSESIFEVQFAVSSATGDASTQGVALAHPYLPPWGCCGFYQASQNLVNAYRTNENGLPFLDNFNDTDVSSNSAAPTTAPLDPRLDHTVGRPGILYKKFQIHQTDFVRDLSYAGPYSSMKHVAEPDATGVNGWGNLSANNYRAMRLGMVILWLAEVEVELGNLETARGLVNRIRKRAGNETDFVPAAIQDPDNRQKYTVDEDNDAANYVVNTYDSPWTDQATARKAVRFETRLEFALEGHRFFDLQRWGNSAEVLNAYLQSEGGKRIYLQGANFVKGRNEFYPIPVEAIDRSTLNGEATITQDPNY